MNKDQLVLGDFCQIVQGGKLKLSGNDFVPQGFPAYGAGGLNGYLDVAEFDCEAVILSAIGARCGKCFHVNGQWTSLANTQVIIPDPDRADSRFLWHQLNDERRWPRSGTGQPFIKPSDVKRHKVCLPPLEEQRRIAAILDKVASIHQTAGQAQARIGQIEASVFDKYFSIDSAQVSWEIGPLSFFCDLITDGEHQTPKRTQAGIKLLSARNIQNGKLDYAKVDFVPEHEFARISKRCAPRRGDILISCSGSIGRVAAYDSDEPVALVRSVALVRAKPDKLRPLFLEFLLRTPRMQALMQRSANASSQANLFQGPIKALQVFSPPLARQDAFADEIGRLGHINSSLDRRAASLRELTNSMSDHLLQSK